MQVIAKKMFNDVDGNLIEPGFFGELIASKEDIKVKWINGETSTLLDSQVDFLDIDFEFDSDLRKFSSQLRGLPKAIAKKIIAGEDKEIGELVEDAYFDFSSVNIRNLHSSLIQESAKEEYEGKTKEELEQSLKIMAGQYVRNRGLLAKTKEVVNVIKKLLKLVEDKLGVKTIEKAVNDQLAKMKEIGEVLYEQDALVEESGYYNDKLRAFSVKMTPSSKKWQSLAKIKVIVEELAEKYGESNEVIQEFYEKAITETEATKSLVISMMPNWEDELEPILSPSEIIKKIKEVVTEEQIQKISSFDVEANIVSKIFNTIKSIWNGVVGIFNKVVDFVKDITSTQEDIKFLHEELEEKLVELEA